MNKMIKRCIIEIEMKKRGFTLVELLVVIAIMSILTVITVSQFQTAKRKANDVQRKADLSGLGKALQMYYADYGVFPESSGGMLAIRDSVGSLVPIIWGEEFVDKGYVYMKVMPKENNDNWDYCYETSIDLKKFGLYSNLENEADGDYNAIGYRCNDTTYHFTIVSPNAQPGDPDLDVTTP